MAEITDKKLLGKLGEDTAAEQYICDGYEVIARNYHSRYGEIDLVLQGRGFIVFAEVKLRKNGSLVSPAQSVSYNKQRKLILTAESYLMHSPSKLQPRFDVVEVVHDGGRILSCNRIEDAFRLD